MVHYQIKATITVLANSDDEAKARVADFLSSAFVREYEHVVDYSVEEIEDVYPAQFYKASN